MKRLVIIVPDTITRSVSNFKEIHRQAIPVTGQSIINALVYDAYDENYFFPPGSVQVKSIDDYADQRSGESKPAMIKEAVLPEQRMHMLLDIRLMPFEKAMSRIIAFLDARQIDVYLFDNDRFAGNDTTPQREIITYATQQESAPGLPQAGDATPLQEERETIYETPLVVEGHQIGHCRIERHMTDGFDRDLWIKDIEFITPAAARIIQANQHRIQSRKAYIDDLTQLYNWRKLNEQMGRMFKQFKTGRKELFVAMIDIDKFKIINDTYGHLAGDEVLRQAALVIRDGVPHVYRYCSELFCAVFYGQDKLEVLDAVESLRKRIEQMSFQAAGLEFKITVSSGIAEFETSMNCFMDVIDRADKALYVSKEEGRNRSMFYDDIKERYQAEASRLRQRTMMLEEELRLLREELARKKRPLN